MVATEARPILRLTSAWTPLKPHQHQYDLWNSSARFKLIFAARRSGKTTVACRYLVMALWDAYTNPKTHTDVRFLAAAPTRQQTKKVFWSKLKDLIPSDWIESINETELSVKTLWGAEIICLGMDAPNRAEGVGYDGVVLDEAADMRLHEVWDRHLLPALGDRQGWAWIMGTPDRDGVGQVRYEELVNEAKQDRTGKYAFFTWPSADILPPDEIEMARKTLSPEIFRQEYLGEFVFSSGRAFPDFDPQIHVKPIGYDPSLPLCWSLDFNIAADKPASSLIIQSHKGEIRIIDEMMLNQVQTSIVCETFLDRAEKNKWDLNNLQLYGDATGNAKDSSSGRSDWMIIKNSLKNINGLKTKVGLSNPLIKDTINAVNARIKSADGQSHLIIDPHCTQIVKDLRSALWPGDLEPFHCLSAFRYYVHSEFPIKRDRIVMGTVGFVSRH